MTQRIDQIFSRFAQLHPKLIDLGLDRTLDLLADLGDPHLRLPPVVHISGTNGKGSVLAMLRAILQTAGLRVHRYTSPHLVRFNERIELAGTPIDDANLLGVLNEVEACNNGRPITQFEITTCAAFVAFARSPADILLLETGLGGRLDATNVVAAPVVTAITPVSMDHQNFLGSDLAGIAAEKAGILKAGVPAVIGHQDPVAMAVIEGRATAIGATLFARDRDWFVDLFDGSYTYRSDQRTVAINGLALHGAYQFANAAQAIAICDQLPFETVADQTIAAGLATTHWPARLQPLTDHPLTAALGPGWDVWLDGGHNPAAGACLAAAAKDWRKAAVSDGRSDLRLIVGMLSTKDVAGFLGPLASEITSLHAISIPDQAATIAPEDLAREAAKLGINATTAPDIWSAITAIKQQSSQPGRVLICGSLYLAGSVLALD